MSRARTVQMRANLQPDYYMTYYTMLVAQKGFSVVTSCDRARTGRHHFRSMRVADAERNQPRVARAWADQVDVLRRWRSL
jgi:hypothetical protein